MENLLLCPVCHQEFLPSYYFCHNCGKNLQPRPLSTSLTAQLGLYLKTLLLPPIGIIWGFRYLRQPDTNSKFVGLLVIIITIIEIIWFVQLTVTTVDTVNSQIFQQIKLYGL